MELDLRQLLLLLSRKIWLILLVTCIALIAAFSISKFLITPLYSTSTTMYVNTYAKEQDISSTDMNDINVAKSLSETYMVLVESDAVLDKVSLKLGDGYTSKILKDKVTCSSVNNTEIFSIEVTDPDPQEAALIANTIADTTKNEIIRVFETGSVKVVDPAKVPQFPSSPHIILNTMVGAILGFIISILCVVIHNSFDRSVKGEEDLKSHYNVPILGIIPPRNLDKTGRPYHEA